MLLPTSVSRRPVLETKATVLRPARSAAMPTSGSKRMFVQKTTTCATSLSQLRLHTRFHSLTTVLPWSLRLNSQAAQGTVRADAPPVGRFPHRAAAEVPGGVPRNGQRFPRARAHVGESGRPRAPVVQFAHRIPEEACLGERDAGCDHCDDEQPHLEHAVAERNADSGAIRALATVQLGLLRPQL
ncbi:hypothetical protein MTO96_019477 [Rhipicephalus appendiculatus]